MGKGDKLAEDTFDFPVSSQRTWDQHGRTPPVVRAFKTDSPLLCIHQAHEVSFGTKWIVSHMPTGVRVWSFANSVEQGRVFAAALEALVGHERLSEWRVDYATNTANLSEQDFLLIAQAKGIAHREVGV